MRAFTDAGGHAWWVEVDCRCRRAVRAATGGAVDPFAALDGTAQRALSDPDNLLAALWSLCREQAAGRGVTAAAFARGLRGDALPRATEALLGAIADFYPEDAPKDPPARADDRPPDPAEAGAGGGTGPADVERAAHGFAGLCGVDPGPHSLRQLRWMAEARLRDGWDRTAAVLAMLYNVNRDPAQTPPATPAEFNPFRAAAAVEPAADDGSGFIALRAIFCPDSLEAR